MTTKGSRFPETGQTVSTKSSRIRQRHLAVDLLGITMGSFIVDAVTRHNWTSGLAALVLGGALYVLDREGIENEEKNG